MSKVTTAYDNLRTRIAAVLTTGNGWLEIPNPYNVQINSVTFLKQGWGIAIGPGSNARRELSCNIHIDRTFSVSISKQMFTTEGNPEIVVDTVQEIYEALYLVIKDFETNTTLNSGQIFCTYENDTGIQTFDADDFSVLYLTANFTTILIENIGG